MLDLALSLCARPGPRVVFLTGAGISAESGIPTFRGGEGYWTVGATEYRPQELATHEAFARMPHEIWGWYLYRRTVCRAAAPNLAHHALVRAEAALGDRFALVTQNVDGLHRRAGTSDARNHEIHGNIDLARCAAECTPARWPLGDEVGDFAKGDVVDAALAARLRCPRCGGPARPHVLWFDESYDEPRYHLDTVRALTPTLLIVVGTSAQTNLPWQVVERAAAGGAAIIDVNPDDNAFGEIAKRHGGAAVRAGAVGSIPAMVDAIIGAAA